MVIYLSKMCDTCTISRDAQKRSARESTDLPSRSLSTRGQALQRLFILVRCNLHRASYGRVDSTADCQGKRKPRPCFRMQTQEMYNMIQADGSLKSRQKAYGKSIVYSSCLLHFASQVQDLKENIKIRRWPHLMGRQVNTELKEMLLATHRVTAAPERTVTCPAASQPAGAAAALWRHQDPPRKR